MLLAWDFVDGCSGEKYNMPCMLNFGCSLLIVMRVRRLSLCFIGACHVSRLSWRLNVHFLARVCIKAVKFMSNHHAQPSSSASLQDGA